MQVLQAPLGIQPSLLGNSRPLGQSSFLLRPLWGLHQRFAPLVNAKKLTLILPTPLIRQSRFLQANYQPLNESNFEFPFIESEPFQEPLENENSAVEEQNSSLLEESFLPKQLLTAESVFSPVTETSSDKDLGDETTSPDSSKLSKLSHSLNTNSSKESRSKSSSEIPEVTARLRRLRTRITPKITETGENAAIETADIQPINELDIEKNHEGTMSFVPEDTLGLDLSDRTLDTPEILYQASDLKSVSTDLNNQIYIEETLEKIDIEIHPLQKNRLKIKQNGKQSRELSSKKKLYTSNTDRRKQQKPREKTKTKKHNLDKTIAISDRKSSRLQESSKTNSRKTKQGKKSSDAIPLDLSTKINSPTTASSTSLPDELPVSNQSVEDVSVLSLSPESRDETNQSQSDSPDSNNDRSPLIQSFVQPPFVQPSLEQNRFDNAVTSQIVFEPSQASQPNTSQVIQEFTASVQPPQGFSVGGTVTTSRSPTKSIDPSDTVPAMLTPGEFVINVEDAQKHLPLLHHINQGGNLDTAPVPIQNTATSKSSPNSSSLVPANLLAGSHKELSSIKPLQSGTFDNSGSGSGSDSCSDFGSDSGSDLDSSQASYTPPSLIFRSKLPSPSSLSFSSHPSSSEWSSVEDLLEMNSEPRSKSTSYSAVANSVTSQQSVWQGYAQGGEVTTASTEAATGTETIAASDDTKAANATKAMENTAEKIKAAIETLAQEIYSRLQQRLAIERERQGVYSGRLPW